MPACKLAHFSGDTPIKAPLKNSKFSLKRELDAYRITLCANDDDPHYMGRVWIGQGGWGRKGVGVARGWGSKWRGIFFLIFLLQNVMK